MEVLQVVKILLLILSLAVVFLGWVLVKRLDLRLEKRIDYLEDVVVSLIIMIKNGKFDGDELAKIQARLHLFGKQDEIKQLNDIIKELENLNKLSPIEIPKKQEQILEKIQNLIVGIQNSIRKDLILDKVTLRELFEPILMLRIFK